MKRDWLDKSWLRGSEPRALEVIGWTIVWAVFLGLLFVLMHYEPALRC